MAPKRKSTPSQNPLHSGTSSSSDSTPFHLRFLDDDAHKAFLENFSRRGIHSERQVILADFADTDLPDVIHSRGWESLCDIPVTYLLMLIQEFYSNMHGIDRSVPFFFTRVQGTHIPITPHLVADVFRVPRVKLLDYLGCKRLQIVSKEELKSAFCKRPSEWGERQFTYCSAFAKGLRFSNMVMTFVLYPLSHYNFITEPRARFLLSLLEQLQIFLHILFFLSQMCIGIRLPVISSFSLRLSRGFYAIFLFLFPPSTIFLSCVPQTMLPLNEARRSLGHGSRIQQLLPPVQLHLIQLHPHLFLPLPRTMCPQET